jgi:hypothetical protein
MAAAWKLFLFLLVLGTAPADAQDLYAARQPWSES